MAAIPALTGKETVKMLRALKKKYPEAFDGIKTAGKWRRKADIVDDFAEAIQVYNARVSGSERLSDYIDSDGRRITQLAPIKKLKQKAEREDGDALDEVLHIFGCCGLYKLWWLTLVVASTFASMAVYLLYRGSNTGNDQMNRMTFSICSSMVVLMIISHLVFMVKNRGR